jgi:peptidoglycan/xylan/chitin deacetylase (PgdA/CDA1 family)
MRRRRLLTPRRALSMLATLLLSALLVALLLAYLVYKPPPFLIARLARRWPDVLFSVPTAGKLVALTVDDAPSAYTPEILRVLAENDARATFFVIGAQVAGREDVLSDVVAAGSELGNHAMRDEASRALSDVTLAEQVHRVEDMIRAAYASASGGGGGARGREPPKYFRPGSGFFSDRMRRTVAALGYRLVLGSIYPHDPQIPFASINANHILSMLRPGAIIICHDRRSWTVPMLRQVLPEIRRQGYRIVTVTELLREAEER